MPYTDTDTIHGLMLKIVDKNHGFLSKFCLLFVRKFRKKPIKIVVPDTVRPYIICLPMDKKPVFLSMHDSGPYTKKVAKIGRNPLIPPFPPYST